MRAFLLRTPFHYSSPHASHAPRHTPHTRPDLLRTAVQEAICPSAERRAAHPHAVMSIKSEMTIATYCKRISSPSFWGGESEMLVLSSMLKVPIAVYLPEGHMGYVRLVTYGEAHALTKAGKARPPVKLLYSSGNQCAPLPRVLRFVPAACERCVLTAVCALCVSYDLLL
jgi:hypothetical protein